jgi:transposase
VRHAQAVPPKEFRDDVVRVARQREEGVTIEAGRHRLRDPSESCLTKWMRHRRYRDAGDQAWTESTADAGGAARGCKPADPPMLEQENEVLRRAAAYLSQANLAGTRILPARPKELAADGIPVAVTCRVVKLARAALLPVASPIR